MDLLRVRFSSAGEPELNVEDLRATEQKDLVRLAEADRKRSNTLSAKGDDNGWLTPTEVRSAVGIHVSIHAGYETLLEEARRRGEATIPMTDVQALMVKGAANPVRHAVPQPQREVPPNPLLEAAPSAVPTTPKLLDAYESAIVESFGEVTYQHVSRGFALEGYGGPEMVSYLMGDWRYVIGAHDFTAAVAEALEAGAPIDEAVDGAGKAISARIVDQVRAEGVDAYMVHNSRATQIGIRDKSATAMAAWADDRINVPADPPNTPFSYARTGFSSISHKRVLAADQPMIAFEVDQPRPKDYDRTEYYIPSHVPPTRVRQFFLGFSNWHDVHAYLKPPERQDTWYRVEIPSRDEDGRPTDFVITPITLSTSRMMESWTAEDESWRASDGGDAAFEAKHPLLASTIETIRAGLSPRSRAQE